ncbi:glycoside hydrolase family 127 protein [bacterium]|nr:glycoside hydrolase family 127 protein [bacterium]
MTHNFGKAVSLLIVTAVIHAGCSSRRGGEYPITPIPFNAVTITDSFWRPRIETNRVVTIPYEFRMCEETGRIDNLRKAAGLMDGPYLGRRFNDSDVFKAMEAASYSLIQHPDAGLEVLMDSLVTLIGQAREEDGYLYSARTVDPDNPAPGAGSERWIHLQGSHELYNVGHMYEAAVAYYQATGKRAFLDIALKNADLIDSVFGPGKRMDTPGHQEIEIGLGKLFRVTGEKRYLDLAKFFLDQRGREHDSAPYPDSSVYAIYNGRPYKQDHLPVLEQSEAVGHAVRAVYMYSGMADIAALAGDPSYVKAIDRLWEDVVRGKLYITGGIGARHTSEAFGDAYELPNREAYTETCASVGNVLWNHRMFLMKGESEYIDVLERTLYNGLISGVSFSGDRFFYQNPLESTGGYARSAWFDCACCPPNIARFLPSLSGYMYGQRDTEIFVNLFIGSTASLKVDGVPVTLTQETDYPWQGWIHLTIDPERPLKSTVALRVPGWARNEPVPGDLYRYETSIEDAPLLTVNGKETAAESGDGYLRITRVWQAGDRIELVLPMPVRRVRSHPDVVPNRGRAALQRGPLVFCLEEADNGPDVLSAVLPPDAVLRGVFRPDLLQGVMTIEAGALTAVPYYAWANRGAGSMTVWIKEK